MSQKAEYYLRDISYRQAENLARRIAREERRDADRRAQDLLRREVHRVEGRMQGEVSGLRQECLRRNADIHKQLECNRKLAEALKDRATQQDQRLEAHERALTVLKEHDEELRAQLQENLTWTAQLAERQAKTESQLQEEIARRQAERQRQAQSVQFQQDLASRLLRDLDRAKMQAVGLDTDLKALDSALARGLQLAPSRGHEQAALALLLEVQNKADAAVLECAHRETETGRLRETARLALDAAEMRLSQLREDRDVVYLFDKPLTVLQTALTAVRKEMDTTSQVGGDFGRLLARWEALAEKARRLQSEVEEVWQDKDRVIDQVNRRNHVVQAVIRSLMDVWGSAFELDNTYAVNDDPRSTLLIQTKRSHGKNATIQIDLDGRMQVSFTGYVAMECAKDVEEFRRKLEKAGELKVDQESLRDQPDQPNPSGIDGGGGPLIYKPPVEGKPSKHREERK